MGCTVNPAQDKKKYFAGRVSLFKVASERLTVTEWLNAVIKKSSFSPWHSAEVDQKLGLTPANTCNFTMSVSHFLRAYSNYVLQMLY